MKYEVDQILQIILVLIFESPVDFSKQPKFLIIHECFLGDYIYLLSFLSKYCEWYEVVFNNIRGFFNCIKSSYWNYVQLRNVIYSINSRKTYL